MSHTQYSALLLLLRCWSVCGTLSAAVSRQALANTAPMLNSPTYPVHTLGIGA